jgi:hypothetical protein
MQTAWQASQWTAPHSRTAARCRALQQQVGGGTRNDMQAEQFRDHSCMQHDEALPQAGWPASRH